MSSQEIYEQSRYSDMVSAPCAPPLPLFDRTFNRLSLLSEKASRLNIRSGNIRERTFGPYLVAVAADPSAGSKATVTSVESSFAEALARLEAELDSALDNVDALDARL